MATTTTNLSLRKPESSDVVNVALDIAASMQTLDDKWASSAAADIGAASAAGVALTVARTDHVHKIGSGTVSAPGLPVGESNTGLYRIGTGELGVTIAGTLIATIKAIGLVIETAFTGKHIATPAAPAAGYTKLYAKSDANWYKQTAAGDEVLMLDTDIFTAAGQIPYATGDEAVAVVTAGTSTQILHGGTAPSFSSVATADIANAAVTSAKANLTTAEADLAGDVALNNTANFFDGPSVTLTAGTWFIIGSVLVQDTAGLAGIVAKLWDGTNVESQAQCSVPAASSTGQLTMAGIVVVGSTIAWKVSVRDATSTSGLIKAATTVGSTGNVASHIRAVRIA